MYEKYSTPKSFKKSKVASPFTKNANSSFPSKFATTPRQRRVQISKFDKKVSS